ncbi:MAG: hypothetical protein MJK13_00225 [Pseudomonadales bacterium]|nr:hypothetical protein [Pseudomonadales bacterium]
MLTLTSLVLVICSLFSALLLYRQPSRLSDQSKNIAGIISVCCTFIAAAALLPLFFDPNSEDSEVFLLMLENLLQYLALPLLCSAYLSISLAKSFSRGTWGRWSLVLLAIFELCRRAEVGDYYSATIAIGTSLLFAVSLFYRITDYSLSSLLTRFIATISYAASALLFAKNYSLLETPDVSYFNLCLGLALILFSLVLSKKLALIKD